MPRKLCKRKKKDRPEPSPQASHICGKCRRLADSKKLLCEPEKRKRPKSG